MSANIEIEKSWTVNYDRVTQLMNPAKSRKTINPSLVFLPEIEIRSAQPQGSEQGNQFLVTEVQKIRQKWISQNMRDQMVFRIRTRETEYLTEDKKKSRPTSYSIDTKIYIRSKDFEEHFEEAQKRSENRFELSKPITKEIFKFVSALSKEAFVSKYRIIFTDTKDSYVVKDAAGKEERKWRRYMLDTYVDEEGKRIKDRPPTIEVEFENSKIKNDYRTPSWLEYIIEES